MHRCRSRSAEPDVEMLYYLEPHALERLAMRLQEVAAPGAECLLVHWLGATNYPLSGDAATEILRAHLPVLVRKDDRHRRYRLDAWRMTP